LIQLVLSAFYRKIAERLGVQPGAEMVEAIRQAEAQGAQLVLADRDVDVTLKRVWGYLGFWQKLKLLFQLLISLFVQDDVDEDLIEELKNKDQLEVVMESVGKSFPEVKKRLIDERDVFLAQKIRQAPGRNVLAVVGAGHVQGILEHIRADQDIEPLTRVPPKSIIPILLKWGIPLIILGLIVLGFFKGGTSHSAESLVIWVLVNGTFSALGVLLALAHPLTILSTFLAAPLTSLNPTIAAGWVAGLVQAWVKKPTVADVERLPTTVTSLKGFWMNPLSRILLVVVLANLGSSLGTFLAGSWIAARFF
jgi:pheromone shutdown-related protein TraB